MSKRMLGFQTFIELYGCASQPLRHVETVRQAVLTAARRAKATIVTDLFHEFNPYGVSGVVVIAESHVAIHTWPEHGCVSVDIFSCSPKLSSAVVEAVLAKAFRPTQIERSERAIALPAKLENGKSTRFVKRVDPVSGRGRK